MLGIATPKKKYFGYPPQSESLGIIRVLSMPMDYETPTYQPTHYHIVT